MRLNGSLLVQVYIVFALPLGVKCCHSLASSYQWWSSLLCLQQGEGVEDNLAHINGVHCCTLGGSTQVFIGGWYLLLYLQSGKRAIQEERVVFKCKLSGNILFSLVKLVISQAYRYVHKFSLYE